MKKNMNSTDRIIRLIISAILIVMYFTNTVTGVLATVLLILALVLVLTGMLGFCPLYKALGISTLKRKHSHYH